jgi:hypothetical protein
MKKEGRFKGTKWIKGEKRDRKKKNPQGARMSFRENVVFCQVEVSASG